MFLYNANDQHRPYARTPLYQEFLRCLAEALGGYSMHHEGAVYEIHGLGDTTADMKEFIRLAITHWPLYFEHQNNYHKNSRLYNFNS